MASSTEGVTRVWNFRTGDVIPQSFDTPSEADEFRATLPDGFTNWCLLIPVGPGEPSPFAVS
jgi:hypothetical protein